MASSDSMNLRTQAAIELNQREPGRDGARVVDSLAQGLHTLRNLLCLRLREDVEHNFGLDSMSLPISPMEIERRLESEIDLFQAAVVALHARDHGYLHAEPPWCVEWVLRVLGSDLSARGDECDRAFQYLGMSRQEARLTFTNVLVKTLPEGGRAPLVLFRLFPGSVRIATSTAFADPRTAAELRLQQQGILPSIEDCPQCYAAVLDNGHTCPRCSNPLWSYDYLTTAD
jgi:hypothetical protein